MAIDFGIINKTNDHYFLPFDKVMAYKINGH